MKRLRAQTRVVAFVALCAMALQIVAGFGHVHVTNNSGSPAVAKSVAAAKWSAVQVAVAAHEPATAADSGTPATGDGDALCPVCLVGHLVASAVAASAPALAVPVAYARFAPPPLVSAFESFVAPTAFWGRGPPTS